MTIATISETDRSSDRSDMLHSGIAALDYTVIHLIEHKKYARVCPGAKSKETKNTNRTDQPLMEILILHKLPGLLHDDSVLLKKGESSQVVLTERNKWWLHV